jgi:uncharacterized protein
MRHLLIRLALVTSLALCLLVSSGPQPTLFAQQAETQPAARAVSVSGNGQINVRPDEAVVTVGVQTQSEQASQALSQNSQQMQAVIDALSAAGVPEEEIQTQIVQLQPVIPTPPPDQTAPAGQATNTISPTGYIATNLIEVRVNDLDNLGTLLDSAVAAGGNRIESIRFEVSKPQEALTQARQAAWEDASQKAEQLAELAGAQLGEVVLINEVTSLPFAAVQSAAALDAAAVPIQPGSQLVGVNLQVTWSLTP